MPWARQNARRGEPRSVDRSTEVQFIHLGSVRQVRTRCDSSGSSPQGAEEGKNRSCISKLIAKGYEDNLYTASHGTATSSYTLITYTRGHVLATGRLKYGSPFPGDYVTWRPDDREVQGKRAEAYHTRPRPMHRLNVLSFSWCSKEGYLACFM